MEKKNLTGQLKRLFPVFQQYELLTEIVAKSQRMEIPAGEQIIGVGNRINVVPLVLDGTIKVIREDDEGNEIFLYYIKSGESCAMTLTACLRRDPSSVKAIVESPTDLLALPADVVYDLAHRFPNWNDFMTETYARRFEEMMEVIDHVAFHSMDVRLLKYLIDRSHLLQSRVLTVSRTQIAKDLNSSREVISRLLKQMEKKKLVRIDGSAVELLE
ncbi:Crp/Fnr family transcriptional regulator [Flavilitoribacter nigricans]|uniref:Crp/Fnr family transcriptional regulator n=1 Tax=Flavilitoribacter nigricans (strain ATCC 23147 / DSM 23189 / NBRC 102662 / NCIMB 1420 / SS-2) TaxID=1122177 RepID=A0A2D0NBM3_FLAN2|nr:Crp/Fnr family transcriptional regulator [Flavilitoribacter nigricans]PHN05912.1 Crp/Fnr family transcriptional regulator [Flavilitoribacter nigricans DSM 23189 = NBRC 102662]